MDSMAKKNQNVTKPAVSLFALFAQSLPNIATPPTFSMVLVEILKLASQLNLAAILLIEFLNFEFGFIIIIIIIIWHHFSTIFWEIGLKWPQNVAKFEIQKSDQ